MLFYLSFEIFSWITKEYLWLHYITYHDIPRLPATDYNIIFHIIYNCSNNDYVNYYYSIDKFVVFGNVQVEGLWFTTTFMRTNVIV